MNSGSALSGVRVLALEQAVAGPMTTHVLADLGADVVKIERPDGGDLIRDWDDVVSGLSTGFVWLNRAKKSVVVDAKADGGREILRRLAEEADVLLTNLGPGVIDRMGLGYSALQQQNPRLIHCSISGYGLTGPYSDTKAYDLLVQGESGLIATTGTPDAPARIGIPITDIAAAMYAATSILAALIQRDRTGHGQQIDVSMFEATLEWLGYFPHYVWHRGEEPGRHGLRHHYIVPYGPYTAADGELVNMSVASDRDWRNLCEVVLDRSDLLEDARFSDMQNRRENREVLESIIASEFLQRPADEWFKRLANAGMPHGRVRSVHQVLEHPQISARSLIRTVGSPVGPLPTVESPMRMSMSVPASGPIPSLGEHTHSVLSEVGYSEKSLRELERAGAIQQRDLNPQRSVAGSSEETDE